MSVPTNPRSAERCAPNRLVFRSRLQCSAIGILLGAAPVCLAQSGGGYDLRWNVQAAGGGTMSANGYVLSGTIAEHDANAHGAMTGLANYALTGGFWAGVQETNDVIFRTGFELPP